MPVGLIAHLTQLKPRQVRECLFVMIQHNTAVYAESLERTRIVTYYEVNRQELLHRAMIPKVLHDSQVWFESEGGLVAMTMLTHGKMTINDCLKEILATHPSSFLGTSSSSSGKTQEQRKVLMIYATCRGKPMIASGSLAIKKAFTKMVKQKCLIAVRPSDSLTEADKDMAEEKRETDKMTMPPTAAELATIRKTLGAQKQMNQGSNIVGLKRTLETYDMDEYGGSKRSKVKEGDMSIVETVEADVFFKINFERYIIRWRNTQIAALYETRLNPTAKAIMKRFLELAEERMINIKEDFTTPVNSLTVSSSLPEDVNIMDTLEFDPQELGSSNVKPKHYECFDKYIQVLEDDLMQILKRDSGRSGHHIVSLKAAARILKRNLIQDIVSSRFGAPYVRIMNMLLEKGKLEEKQISRFSMMPVKDVREKLTTLCTFGVLNLQEVPKTNDRAPSRTYYLWEVLLPRAASALVDRLYHTMANLRQRRFVERSKRAVLLEKCERSDVKADQSLLNDTERRELETLEGVLEMLAVQELRVAEMVVILKEY
ncbi:RNA polymerase III subunit C82 [Mortierella claussenii]|nr:RNA polymerase III subunit C82 [Mortierella claussenii]